MSEHAQQVGSLPEVKSLREEPMVREGLWREIHRLFSEQRWSKLAIARELGLDVKTVRRSLQQTSVAALPAGRAIGHAARATQ